MAKAPKQTSTKKKPTPVKKGVGALKKATKKELEELHGGRAVTPQEIWPWG